MYGYSDGQTTAPRSLKIIPTRVVVVMGFVEVEQLGKWKEETMQGGRRELEGCAIITKMIECVFPSSASATSLARRLGE